jgi:hypothetical protein
LRKRRPRMRCVRAGVARSVSKLRLRRRGHRGGTQIDYKAQDDGSNAHSAS